MKLMVVLIESIHRMIQWIKMMAMSVDPQYLQLSIQFLLTGAFGAMIMSMLHGIFRGICVTPWETVYLTVHLIGIVSSIIVNFVTRGGKCKFQNWTLRFEILRAVIRECTRGARGTRMMSDVKYASVIRSQSAVCGTIMGWFACQQSNRRIESVYFNHLEHIWLRSPTTRSRKTKTFVVLYIHGGGFALLSPRLYISFGNTLAVAIEKEVRQQLLIDESVLVDVFLSNYRKAPEYYFPLPAEDICRWWFGHVNSTKKIDPDIDKEALSAHCFLSPEIITAGRLAYHVTASDPTTWADASSVHCDLRGLPPVLIQAASFDYIYQHSIRLAQKAVLDGVTNWEIDIHKEMPHVFSVVPSYVLPYAQIGVLRLAKFAAKHIIKCQVNHPSIKSIIKENVLQQQIAIGNMVELFCALVGEARNVFCVTIDASKSVGHLKAAIKTKNKLKSIDASRLKLFLAKKGEAWLTQKQVDEGIYGTSDFKRLKVVAAPLYLVGLSEKDVTFEVTMGDVETKSTPVHVLVVVPTKKVDTVAANRRAASSMIILAAEPTKIFVKVYEFTREEEDWQELTINVVDELSRTNARIIVRTFWTKSTSSMTGTSAHSRSSAWKGHQAWENRN
ncbi:CRN-like protein [Plasmopara halstedii]|uniref:CRN-like protein n=1 Tax=Plasmopara halstedii TaxID=4781 RepID=A0A0P1ABQ5_PLAHL|nr:CRN-like protein [Plasmopara halstedii]CEG37824.1 CRN-like protein [Plasmopara halstedii]|eukprot:XP_024574193.1 CRN-like protein [Plasmopara halstedii]